jgi:ribonuclease T1
VPTPGARDRGAGRIIAGGRDLRAPSELWYSDDHYNSFRRIRE